MSEEIARRAKHQLHLVAGFRRELRPHFLQRKLQVGGRCHGMSLALCRRGQQADEQKNVQRA